MRTTAGTRVPLRVCDWATIAAVLGAALCTPVAAQVAVTVPGSSDPYLAGMPNGSTCCGGDSAPAQSPVQVTGLPLTAGSTLTFSVTGSVDNTGAIPTLSPDGGGVFTTSSNNGISGGTWPLNSLVGVFLDNTLPTATSAPAALDFSTGAGTSFTTLSPALKQVFFIGDGRTGTGSGATQTFVVPAGATRLYLGTTDGFGWFNNSGAFAVSVASSAPTGVSAPVPTLSSWMLGLLMAGLAVAAAFLLRRS